MSQELLNKLAAPFHPDEVKCKPSVVSGNRALAMFYVDARTIMDRLDEVLGVAGWQDEYQFLEGGCVLCKLRLKVGDEWVMKMDVGGPSGQPDAGDRVKAATSDALKRTAVKFGVGRYLYRLPVQWCDYDPQKRAFARRPVVPGAARPAVPGPAPARQPAPAADPQYTDAKKVEELRNTLRIAKSLNRQNEILNTVKTQHNFAPADYKAFYDLYQECRAKLSGAPVSAN